MWLDKIIMALKRLKKVSKIHKIEGFSRIFPIPIDMKYRPSAYDPKSPYVAKGHYAVATKIVAADGSGDFENIQEAIDDLPSSGGVVYIKEGTYTLSSSISVSSSSVSIFGSGPSTIISWSGNFSAFSVSASSFVLRDVKLSGPGNTNTSAHGVSLSGNDNSIIKCWFSNCRHGLTFASGSTGNFISNNYFSNCYYGLVFDDASRNLVLSNSFYACFRGIYAHNHSSNNVYSSNVLNGCSGFSFYLSAEYDSVISSNLIFLGSSYGLCIDNGATDLVISGNHISSNYAGIYMLTARYSTITGNKVESSSSGSGIELQNSDQNIISANNCKDNSSYEIKVDSNSDRVIIIGNLCMGSHTGAILNNGTNSQMAHNITS